MIRGPAIAQRLAIAAASFSGGTCAPWSREWRNWRAKPFPRTMRITAYVADDPWPVRGNATQLHQALLNLRVNARELRNILERSLLRTFDESRGLALDRAGLGAAQGPIPATTLFQREFVGRDRPDAGDLQPATSPGGAIHLAVALAVTSVAARNGSWLVRAPLPGGGLRAGGADDVRFPVGTRDADAVWRSAPPGNLQTQTRGGVGRPGISYTGR